MIWLSDTTIAKNSIHLKRTLNYSACTQTANVLVCSRCKRKQSPLELLQVDYNAKSFKLVNRNREERVSAYAHKCQVTFRVREYWAETYVTAQHLRIRSF